MSLDCHATNDEEKLPRLTQTKTRTQNNYDIIEITPKMSKNTFPSPPALDPPCSFCHTTPFI